jgi:hypothetical protein
VLKILYSGSSQIMVHHGGVDRTTATYFVQKDVVENPIRTK